MNVIKEGVRIPLLDHYVQLLKQHYAENKCTSPIQIDSLVLLYRISRSQKVFSLLFECHKKLLHSIIRDRFNYYKGNLYNEDYYELQGIVYIEFYRRVLFYKIPPEAPFSKYIKLFLKKWTNTYTKLMVNKNKKTLFLSDINVNKIQILENGLILVVEVEEDDEYRE